ncbi:hypothetical protein D9M71_592870 [compost metagenome]
MVDALDLEQVQRFPDVLRRTFLAGMGDGAETLRTRLVEHPLKLARRVADFRAVEADGDERIAERHGLLQGLERFFLGQMTEEAEDQPVADAQLLLAVPERGLDASDHHVEGNAAVGVGLRVEERLDVDYALRLALLQVGPGQVVEVLLAAQHVRAGIVEIEEFLQVVEGVGLAQGLDVGPGQHDAVAFGEGEQQLRLQRAFEVQVQFRLGQRVDPFVHGEVSLSG